MLFYVHVVGRSFLPPMVAHALLRHCPTVCQAPMLSRHTGPLSDLRSMWRYVQISYCQITLCEMTRTQAPLSGMKCTDRMSLPPSHHSTTCLPWGHVTWLEIQAFHFTSCGRQMKLERLGSRIICACTYVQCALYTCTRCEGFVTP